MNFIMPPNISIMHGQISSSSCAGPSDEAALLFLFQLKSGPVVLQEEVSCPVIVLVCHLLFNLL